jgi:hypothetical protein
MDKVQKASNSEPYFYLAIWPSCWERHEITPQRKKDACWPYMKIYSTATLSYRPCSWGTLFSHDSKQSIPPAAVPLWIFSSLLFFKSVWITDKLDVWAVGRVSYCKYGSTLLLWAAYKIQRVGSYGHCQVSESLHIPVCLRGDHQPSSTLTHFLITFTDSTPNKQRDTSTKN